MEVFKGRNAINKFIRRLKQKDRKIGFVPTMGALHKGHLSLVRCSIQENDITVVSIFVNPTQFNNPEDLKNYPRRLDEDLAVLREEGVDIAFTPENDEMYPEKDIRVFDFGGLDRVMEGRYREGHFNGVARIVSKLFFTVEPHRAYFGEKDFQQFVIIKALTNQLNLPIKIISCPILREKDGLAMSSRNIRLNEQQRAHAPVIYKTLRAAVNKTQDFSVDALKQWVKEQINQDPYLQVEYFEIVEDEQLKPVESWQENNKKVGCIAVYCGNVRLIDNIRF